MSESKEFQDFKKRIMEENEKNFGNEIREKYGDDAADTSNDIIMGLTEERWNKSEQLRVKYEDLLRRAVEEKLDFNDERVTEMCRIHGEWISIFWNEGVYSYEAHKALAEVYNTDERFKQYYDNIVSGGSEYLSKAIINYCDKLSSENEN